MSAPTLVRPRCRAELQRQRDLLDCARCDAEFDVVDDAPILLQLNVVLRKPEVTRL